MTASLSTALGVDDDGVVCAVGAGGKKSALYRLAAERGRAVVTATVRIPIFDDAVGRVATTTDPAAAVRAASDADWPLGVVPEREREDRYRGYDPAVVSAFAADADVPVLVKADGARTRWLKAPNEREPQVPRAATLVCPVVSARVVGEPLAEGHVHRPERVAALTGRGMGETLTATDVAAVIAADDGGMKGVPAGARAIPLVNMVDTPALESTARDVAAELLARTDCPRVVLTRLVADDPVVAVVERA